MTVGALALSRCFAFGSIADGLWGAAWLPSEGEATIALGAPPNARTAVVSVEDHESDTAWRVLGDGIELELSPLAGAVERPDGAFDQLIRCEGQLDGGQRTAGCLGWRGAGAEDPVSGEVSSFRQLAAWFEPGEGLALLALRPRSAAGQESDRLLAAVLGPQDAGAVADPRLSTTYGRDGRPVRAGLELWIGDEQEDQFPRRAAGEAVGTPIAWSVGRLELQAQLFRWHSRGEDGAGVYLLGETR